MAQESVAKEGRARGTRLRVLHHALTLLILASAVAASLQGIVILQRLHEQLSRHLGSLFWWLAFLAYASLAATSFTFVSRARAWRRGLWTAACGIESRLAFSICVGLLLFVLLRIQPAHDVYLKLSLAIAAGCYATLLLFLQRRDGSPRSFFTRAIDFGLFNLCLLSVAAELVLSAWAAVQPGPILTRFDPGPAHVVRSFRQKPGDLRWGEPVNSQGYSDDELRPRLQGEKLVIAIGDSQSVGAVPNSLHYTAVCERALSGVEVYNMGVPSIGPPEYLHLLMTEALPLQPDAVVIGLFVGNDICFHDPRARAGWRRWVVPGAYLALSVPRRLLRVRQERRARPGGVVGEVQQASVAPDGRLASLDDFVREYPWMGDPTLEEPTFSEERFEAIEASRVLNGCTSASGCYEKLFEILDEIRVACGAVPLLILLIPDEFQVDDDVWELAASEARRVSPGGDLDRFRPQQLIGRWLEAAQIPYLDVLPPLLLVEPLLHGRRHLYHLRDTHLNVRGNVVTGEALAEALRALLSKGN